MYFIQSLSKHTKELVELNYFECFNLQNEEKQHRDNTVKKPKHNLNYIFSNC
jgi:hypothetical protein